MINYEISFFGHCRFLRLISATAVLLVDPRKTCYVTMLTDRLCISLGPAPRALGPRSVVRSSRSPTRSFSTARRCRIFCARASRGGSGGVPNRVFNKPLRPEKPPPASQRSRPHRVSRITFICNRNKVPVNSKLPCRSWCVPCTHTHLGDVW